MKLRVPAAILGACMLLSANGCKTVIVHILLICQRHICHVWIVCHVYPPFFLP
ncbi:MAG: hypothetical protein IIX22_08095 [Ruminococcus sp.]|nr:hypothetical protein [Ruminococcus sp.]